MGHVIRPCEPGDVEALVTLCEKHAAHEKSAYTATGKADALRSALFCLDSLLHCLVAEDEKRLIGYCTYTFDFSTWDAAHYLHMDCLFVDGHFRGQGIGLKMINQLIAVAKQKNCVNMQWQTPTFNTGAIRFYNRLGAVAREKQRFTLDLRTRSN